MKLMRKLLSVVLTTAIVAGCGAIVNADSLNAINSSNFPDPEFRKYVSANFDTNKDGYLDTAEKNSQRSVTISDLAAKSLKGIELLNINYLVVYKCNVTELDLSGTRITNFCALGCGMLRSFKGGMYQEKIELSMCNYLMNLDLSKCIVLEDLTLVSDERISNLDLTPNRYLRNLTISNCQDIKTINFNDSTKLRYVYIQKTPINNIDLSKVLDLNYIKTFILSTNGTLRSYKVSGTVLNFLWNHRRANNKGYEYSGSDFYLLID